MKNLNQILMLAACAGLAMGCGNAVTQKASTDSAVNQLKSMGPPLIEAEEDPSLLEEYACGARNEKVQICHVPPGNPDNRHNICIGRAAVEAHLAHAKSDSQSNTVSDYLGDCAGTPDDGSGGDGDDDGDGDGSVPTEPTEGPGDFVE